MRAAGGLLRGDRQEQSRPRHQNDQDAGRRVRRGVRLREIRRGYCVSEVATLVPPGGLPSPTASKKTFGVEAIRVTKRFGEFTALDAVSLKVHPGTFHALLGEN